MFTDKIDEIGFLFVAFVILVITLAGCTPETVNNYYLDTDVVVEGPEDNGNGGAEEPADDDDSGEEPDQPSDDDDSAKDDEEPQDAALEIRFLTYALDGAFTVFPGDEDVVLGRYLFTASGAVTVRRMFAPIAFNPTPEAIYGVYDLNEVEIAQHVESCVMVNTATGNVIAGPAWPGLNGVFEFVDQFTLVDEQMVLEFRCDMTSTEPEGTYDGFTHLFLDYQEVVNADGQWVYPSIAGSNGTAWSPTLHAILTETPVEAPSVYIGMNAASPYGASVPGWSDIFRFDICVGPEMSIEITNTKFAIPTTDNAGTGWNTCGQLGSANKFTLYNITNGFTPVTAGLSFISSYDTDCNLVPTVELGSFNALISNEVIAAGTCVTYELWADSSGASSVGDDVIQATIFSEEWFTWMDEDGNEYDGSDTNGSFPIIGHLLVF